MNSFEKMQFESGQEVMKVPEIVVEEEKGAQILSVLLKAENKEWGETETSLAKETTEYFEHNPLSPEILEIIRDFHTQGVDEETLYNLALTYQRPERAEKVFEMAAKYKPHVENLQEIHQKLLGVLESFNQDFSSTSLAQKFGEEIEQDKKQRLERMGKNRERIKSLIGFFKPDSETTNVQKLNFVPTDPLYRKDAGRGFSAFPGEQIIISDIENTSNQDHEFLHGIINPIVDKLSEKLSEEQKQKISELGSRKLRVEQDYGEGFYSLLCEEFIRTYNDVVQRGKKPMLYEDFTRKISEISEGDFMEMIRKDNNLKNRFDEMGIKTLEDLKNDSREYFDKFEHNQLREIVFEFYQRYIREKEENPQTNFEDFVLAEFEKEI